MGNIRIGRICIPVNPGEVAQFDPKAVPTVGQLLRELDEQAVDEGDEQAGSYHSNTMRYRLTVLINQTGNARLYDQMSKCWMHTSGVECRKPVQPCSVWALTSLLKFTHLFLSIGGMNKLDW